MNYKEITYVIVFSMIKTIVVMVVSFLLFYIIRFNYHLALDFCKSISISEDLVLTTFSFGFANDLTVVLTVIGVIFFFPLMKLMENIERRLNKFLYLS